VDRGPRIEAKAAQRHLGRRSSIARAASETQYVSTTCLAGKTLVSTVIATPMLLPRIRDGHRKPVRSYSLELGTELERFSPDAMCRARGRYRSRAANTRAFAGTLSTARRLVLFIDFSSRS
jgi:hypothetical protein